MFTMFFTIMMIAVFGRLISFAFRASWGIMRVLGTLIILPGIILFGFFRGMLWLALPILILSGIGSLLAGPGQRYY